MKSIFNVIILLFALVAGATQTATQKKFNLKIVLNDSLKGKDFVVSYDDGVSNHFVHDSFSNHQLTLTGTYSSGCITLNLQYKAGPVSYSDAYFIGSKAAVIEFMNTGITVDPFKYCKTINAVEVYRSKMAEKRKQYSIDAINEMNTFINTKGALLGKVDSIKSEFYNRLNKVNQKDLEFVKAHSDDYFSFWWFRTKIIPSDLVAHNNDTAETRKLLNTLETAFPQKYFNSPEGQGLLTFLSKRLSVKKNTMASNFARRGIDGHLIRLQDYQGKYVLLDFWASWCGPCHRMIPQMKALYKKYHAKGLEVIGISVDTDTSLWKKSVFTEGLDMWANILNKDDFVGDNGIPGLEIQYGVKAYPTVFLLDKKGTIIGRYEGFNANRQSAMTEQLKRIFK